jgi:hypothetical protein
VLFVACGTNSDSANDSVVNAPANYKQFDSYNHDGQADDKAIYFNQYNVPDKNIVIDVPDYDEIEEGLSKFYVLYGSRYIAITVANGSTATSLDMAHKDVLTQFKEDVQKYHCVNSLSIVSESIDTINDMKVYKYEGTLNCGKDLPYDAYIVGYSFIRDNTPCSIIGVATDQNQDDAVINSIRKTVETMVKTMRKQHV